MAEKQTLGNAVSSFEQQFKKFQDSGNKPPEFLLSKKRVAAKALATEKARKGKKDVVAAYRQLLSPESFFGDFSAIAQQLEDDKNLLVRAYDLFVALVDLNRQLGDKDTFITDFTIASPLTQRERYTTGSDFVYLQFWLQWEAKRTDYVPVLRLARGQPGWQLVFVPSGSFSWTDWELSVVQLLEEEFYKGRMPGLEAADGSDAAVEARS
ncbi:MAG: hypothetical protein IJW57_10265 [Spirochaetaceae bacterium]|nr:hypothetical protein [Spirochaetaceae bacterium]MBQ8562114.1 hypothetical protein [Spirochaetaceae bacterium]